MKTIRIGGVPEHFNYPWHYGRTNGIFKNEGLSIEWSDVKGGSGAMCKMLEEGELDIALVLTEGIVKNIHAGSDSRIVQQFVKSPLIWGVHSAPQKGIHAEDLSSARIARSRIGSGSHLMAYVHAEQQGYDIADSNFVTVGNIDGAIDAFKNNTADILLWEKFMTQPYVDRNEVKRIGQCISPWPCFMMVASGSFLEKNESLLTALSAAINASCKEVIHRADTVERIAEMYHLELEQVKKWYSSVEWQTSPWISEKMLQNVATTLQRVDILGAEVVSAKEMCVKNAFIY